MANTQQSIQSSSWEQQCADLFQNPKLQIGKNIYSPKQIQAVKSNSTTLTLVLNYNLMIVQPSKLVIAHFTHENVVSAQGHSLYLKLSLERSKKFDHCISLVRTQK